MKLRPRRSSRRARLTAVAGAAAVLAALAACSSGSAASTASGGATAQATASGAASSGAAAASTGNPNQPETTDISVGGFPSNASSAIWAAIDSGYFKKYGLNVKLVPITSTASAASQLVAGSLQFIYSSYPGVILLGERGESLDVAAEADAAAPGSAVIMVMPKSTLKGPEDLIGKKVAEPSINSSDDLRLNAYLQSKGLDFKQVHYVALPQNQMGAALQNGTVDAAFLGPPFVAQAEQSLGAKPLWDAASGMFKSFADVGWVTSASFAKANPNTVAAFQCAEVAGAKKADADKAYYEQINLKYTTVTKQVLDASPQLIVPTTLRTDRILQNVQFMQSTGVTSAPYDLASHIISLPANC